MDKDTSKIRALERWCLEQADDCRKVHGLLLDENSRLKLAKAIGAAVQRASLKLACLARGEDPQGAWGPSDWPLMRPIRAGAPIERRSVRFDELVKGWMSERRPVEKTVYEWSRALRQLSEFLGHDYAGRLTADDLIAWKESLVAADLRPKTVRDAKLTPVRAILQWAVDNRRLPSNPAERVTIDVKVKSAESKRSFTDEEAAIVLRAALREKDLVRRWVPWLCAYSGARLAEVCQLRVQDILQIDGIWCMKFDPEAGSLKTRSSERAVPLHPAVIECGFLDFVASVKTGPLFAHPSPDKFGSRGGNGTKMLGRWVRSLGLKDERISPSHSWRHRFKTLGRRYQLAPDIVNAVTGHGKRSVADRYGEFPMEALRQEIAKIPAVSIS
ncbi:site-specific integrase [Microvirga splendida]|uniref:Site-specific integrase n=1 Tax=Microvirga splendida TaxID=2795727 RepID=A0ABS0Y519_9HYPH|nr:site-specific integrase [Microvirga splendida]MBJ6127404.1 site-specific integrase [Microvirga splendida]